MKTTFVDYLFVMLNVVWIKSFQCIFMIQHRLVIREVLSMICFSDDIIVHVPYVHLVKLIYFILFLL